MVGGLVKHVSGKVQQIWEIGNGALLNVARNVHHLRDLCNCRLFPVQKIPKWRRARECNRGAAGTSSSRVVGWISSSGRGGCCLCAGRARRAAKSSKDLFPRLSFVTLGGKASGAEITPFRFTYTMSANEAVRGMDAAILFSGHGGTRSDAAALDGRPGCGFPCGRDRLWIPFMRSAMPSCA